MDKLVIGCGYLGRRVAVRWRAQGDRVFATTRGHDSADDLRRLGMEPVLCDVLRPEELKRLPPADTVLFCVGFDRTSGVTMRDVYVHGLANVLDHLPRPGKFLYISSTSVYGQADGSVVDETSPTEPEEEAGQVVLAAENALRASLPQSAILRFAGIYGPGRLLRRHALVAGEAIVGDPERWLNLIHVEDGATAVLAAEEHARPGETFIICDDMPIRRRDFYGELARLLGAPEPRFVVPPADAPLPPHERANRRLSNRKMHRELAVTLQYPSYVEGLSGAPS